MSRATLCLLCLVGLSASATPSFSAPQYYYCTNSVCEYTYKFAPFSIKLFYGTCGPEHGEKKVPQQMSCRPVGLQVSCNKNAKIDGVYKKCTCENGKIGKNNRSPAEIFIKC